MWTFTLQTLKYGCLNPMLTPYFLSLRKDETLGRVYLFLRDAVVPI